MHYTSNTDAQKQEMLTAIGVSKVEDLFKDIPESVRLKDNIKIPSAMSELEIKRHMESIASKNKSHMTSFLGAGAYAHFAPTIVNHLLLRGEFLTAYTPYQPEISQGNLQAIYEFQTMICDLTGMDVANASMYDNSSGLAEAALMACRIKRKNKILIAKTVHPNHRDVVKTYTDANSVEVVELDFENGLTTLEQHDDFAGIIIQQPNFFGSLEDIKKIADFAHEKNAVLVVSVNEPTSLGILKTPGDYGADIVVGEGHSFGNPVSFGGPFVGFMAAKKEHLRQIPGRLVGETVDTNGKKGYVLTLQAREQHIRREKATSNICTNQALNALAVTMTLSALGKELKTLSYQNVQKSHYAAKALEQVGAKLAFSGHFYNEFVVEVSDSARVLQALREHNIVGGLDLETYYPNLKNHILICVTELHTREDIDRLADIVGKAQ